MKDKKYFVTLSLRTVSYEIFATSREQALEMAEEKFEDEYCFDLRELIEVTTASEDRSSPEPEE